MRHLLLHAQAWWDAQRFDQPVWQVAEWHDQKVRHIQLHIAKALGKVVAALGEATATASGTDPMVRVRDEVLPDVAIYRSQLLNTFPDCCLAPGALYRSRISVTVRSATALPPERVPRAELLWRVVLLLSRASAALAAYLEPREHGTGSSAVRIGEAIQDLHDSAVALAAHFAIDLTRAHQARLEALLGAALPVSLLEAGGLQDLFSATEH